MKIKSYFAASVEAALSQARQEMGPEAMLLSTRKAMPEARHLGEYEAVFAAAPSEPEPASTSSPATPKPIETVASQAATAEPPSGLANELADIRRQLETMAQYLSRFSSGSPLASLLTGPTSTSLYSSLIASDIYPELAQSLLSGLKLRGENLSRDQIRNALRSEVGVYCRTDASLGVPGQKQVVALVGPPGSGKTTTLVKLAVKYGLAHRLPTQLLTLDLERIAAADQLQTFASILGVGFQAVATPHLLSQALEEHRTKELILIDTPGYGPRDQDGANALSTFLSSRNDIDVHLVLPAALKPADLSVTVDRFSRFKPRKLLFTRLDETRSFGGILNELARGSQPVSFLTAGQQIPEDIEPATERALTDFILGDICGRSTAAAA
jgi:flagellar biosynthesis protein FlhF